MLEEARLQLRQPSQRHVDAAIRHGQRQLGSVQPDDAQADLGRLAGQRFHQQRQKVDLADIRHGQREAALAVNRVEVLRGGERAADQVQCLRDGGRDAQRIRGGLHATGAAVEQLVTQFLAQAPQRVADGRLRQTQCHGRTRHLPLAQQLREHAQQVQVELTDVHALHYSHHQYRESSSMH